MTDFLSLPATRCFIDSILSGVIARFRPLNFPCAFEWIDKSNKQIGYNLHEGVREIVLSTSKNNTKTASYSNANSKKKTV